MKPDPLPLNDRRGASATSPSTSSHRQTVPSHTDDMDSPPPYSSVPSAPATRTSNDSSVSAGEDRPLQHASRQAHQESYSPQDPMGSTRGPRALFGSDDRPEDGPFGPLRRARDKRGYRAEPNMRSDWTVKFDRSKYENQPGCCFSETGGAWCSSHGGCCCSEDGGAWCSSSEGCCCSANRGTWCSDHGGCCCSDYGGSWFSDGVRPPR